MLYTLDDIQRTVVPIIQQDAEDLRRVIVFGSYAKGTQTSDSDLNLYVDGILEYHSKDILDTEQKISKALSVPVDLITRSALENSVVREKLKNNIEQFGYVLYG